MVGRVDITGEGRAGWGWGHGVGEGLVTSTQADHISVQMTNAPRNHHFIPAFFLKQWTGPDGKLVEYSIKHHKLIPKPVGPDATGYEFDLYAFSELPSDQAQFIEQTFFNYADRTASDALQLHLSNADASAWTVEQKSAWSRFIIALHLRHPDTMPELRAAAQSVWEGTSEASQRQYELIKKPEDPPTFDEYLAARDPLTHTKARVNLILKSFDNEILGKHINNMTWTIVDLSPATNHLLISDRPVTFSNLKEKTATLRLPSVRPNYLSPLIAQQPLISFVVQIRKQLCEPPTRMSSRALVNMFGRKTSRRRVMFKTICRRKWSRHHYSQT
jgi:hypothetical protein